MSIAQGSNLAVYYCKAVRDVYGRDIRVPQDKMPRFLKRELLLTKHGINLKHYADTTARLLRTWCENKGLQYVPYNMFLGEVSLEMYLAHRNKASVELVPNSTDIDFNKAFSTELQFALTLFRIYTNDGKFKSQKDLRDVFLASRNTVITEQWKSHVSNPMKLQQLRMAVIAHFQTSGSGFESGRVITSYEDLFDVYLRNAIDDLRRKKSLKNNKVKFGNLSQREQRIVKAHITSLQSEIRNLKRNLQRDS